MAKPIIKKVSPFDAKYDYTFDIAWTGNRSYKNRLVVSDNETNTVVYDVTETTFALKHTLPANTLINGRRYVAQVQMFDMNDTASSISDKLLFWTFATPDFRFTNLPDGNIIKNSSFNAQIFYYSSDWEDIQGYEFYLYDMTGKELLKSEIFSDPNDISYTYKGLQNNTHYYIRCVGVTVNGLQLDTGNVEIGVKFENPNQYSRIYAVPNEKNGSINISTNINVVQYNGSETFQFENGMIDLTNQMLYYDDGFVLEGDFTLIIRGKNLWKDGVIFKGKNADESTEFIVSSKIYPEELLRFKLSANNGVSNYIIYSEPLEFHDEDMVTIGIRRINNIYSIVVFTEIGYITENNYWYGALRPTTGTSDFDIWIDTENVPTYMVNKDTMQVYLTTSEPTDANVNDLWLDGE